MWTYNRLDLESLGFGPTMPKIFLGMTPPPQCIESLGGNVGE